MYATHTHTRPYTHTHTRTHIRERVTDTDTLRLRTPPPPLTPPPSQTHLRLLGTHIHTQVAYSLLHSTACNLGVLLGTVVPLSLGWGNKKRLSGGRPQIALERPQPLKKGTVFIHSRGNSDRHTGSWSQKWKLLLTQERRWSHRHTGTDIDSKVPELQHTGTDLAKKASEH